MFKLYTFHVCLDTMTMRRMIHVDKCSMPISSCFKANAHLN